VPTLADLRVIPMGVDVEADAPQGRVSSWRDRRTPEGPLVAYVGRLIDWKGVDDLLEAAAILREPLPGFRLVIAGTGPLLEELRDRGRRLGIEAVVEFVGWLDQHDVRALQAAADVVVVPSRIAADGSREAQGLSVVEALALGRPVVATRVGGIPDAIEDEVNGLLVPERDPASIARAVRRIWADRDLGVRLGLAAAERAKGYAWPEIAGRFVELFDDVVARSRPR
jgi:glycosyltransferase involved in cell wall biosynthesis